MLYWMMAALLTPLNEVDSREFDAKHSGFMVVVGDMEIPYQNCAIFVLPGSDTIIGGDEGSSGQIHSECEQGTLAAMPDGRWKWRAPSQPGVAHITVKHKDFDEQVRLTAFVMVPASEVKKGSLNGYSIGDYPEKPYKGLAAYEAPLGFVEVQPEHLDLWVSPHFQLRQFMCKQVSGWPKFLVLQTKLLLKLEYLLQLVNQKGYSCSTFAVLSGFRTPSYNRSIGNVKHSRHMWGGAADIFIDENNDGMLDDLNGDGRITVADAAVLYDLFDGQFGKNRLPNFVGGLGRYRKTSNHGPFVHVDVRGFRARWGD